MRKAFFVTSSEGRYVSLVLGMKFDPMKCLISDLLWWTWHSITDSEKGCFQAKIYVRVFPLQSSDVSQRPRWMQSFLDVTPQELQPRIRKQRRASHPQSLAIGPISFLMRLSIPVRNKCTFSRFHSRLLTNTNSLSRQNWSKQNSPSVSKLRKLSLSLSLFSSAKRKVLPEIRGGLFNLSQWRLSSESSRDRGFPLSFSSSAFFFVYVLWRYSLLPLFEIMKAYAMLITVCRKL